jgi:hypothetical protein
MKCHALLAALIFPVAIMFMVTGSLYTWGIKGSYVNETYDIQLSEALRPELGGLTELAEAELEKQGLSIPSGKPKIKSLGDYFTLEWTGSSKDVVLEPTNNDLIAKLTVKHTSWYRNLVQLHKAKGGTAFKIYAAILAVSIGLLLVSGFAMAWQTPKLKRATINSSLIGVISFIVFVWLS